jgi:hypothetical protein
MITPKEKQIIKAMLLQPHGSKRITIGVQGGNVNTNFKVSDYCYALLQFYQRQYAGAHHDIEYKGKHKSSIGMSRFVHIMCKYFFEQEVWIFRDYPDFNKYKIQVDLLYALQCVKQVFKGHITDSNIYNQSDALVCLIGWNLARLRENVDGETVRGFIDYCEDDQASPTLEDLFEERLREEK